MTRFRRDALGGVSRSVAVESGTDDREVVSGLSSRNTGTSPDADNNLR
jgi:hypothetical protein